MRNAYSMSVVKVAKTKIKVIKSTQASIRGMSRVLMADMVREPKPGKPKRVSTTIKPPKSQPIFIPMMVMVGRSAFFRA